MAAIIDKQMGLEELPKELSDEEENPHHPLDDAQPQCESFGNNATVTIMGSDTITSTNVYPSKCSVVGEGIHSAIVDEASYINIHLKNADGTDCHDDVPIMVFLVHREQTDLTTAGERAPEKNKTNKPSGVKRYRYVPLVPGEHSLRVTIAGEDCYGSPFIVNVSMPLKLSMPELALQGYYTGGVAVGPNNEIAVIGTDWSYWNYMKPWRNYETVHVLDSDLKPTMSFGDWGSGGGQCYYPVGVCFDNEGNILVTDTSNHRIHKYNKYGRHLLTKGVKGTGHLEFCRPTGIKVNSKGKVYVCDRINNRVQILNRDLTYYDEFGGAGNAQENLSWPWDLAFDKQGDVYVVDAGHACIKKFTAFGHFKMSIGPDMDKTESLKSPQMICIDDYDNIFVTDYKRHEVVVFDTKGTYRKCFGGYGGAKGQFNQPRGIAKAKDGTIYVTDPGNYRLQIFR